MSNGLEIERKYLIHMPDAGFLMNCSGCERWSILQTYLYDGDDGSTRRVRSIETKGHTVYVKTVKRFVSGITQSEEEEKISFDEYRSLIRRADPSSVPISKERYRIPYDGQLLEIDIYDFWQDRATVEVELKSEEQQVRLPEWIRVIRDVSRERAYKNKALAKHVPMENIDE